LKFVKEKIQIKNSSRSAKKQSNVSSSGNYEKAPIIPLIIFSLEEALEYIQKDEYVEVTPKSIRLRKIYLTETDRKRYKI